MLGAYRVRKTIAKAGAAGILTALALTSIPARSQLPVITFWKHRVPKLSFSTATQSFPAKTCSGVATIQTKNATGAVTNVSSDLTVNLAGTGSVTFYSDADCTASISSVTVTNGTSSASFYFLDSSVESTTLTASATGYISATQSETTSTNNYVWTGGGGNSLWATGANWSGGSAPSTGNLAVFDGSCTLNCSPTLGANIDVGGVRIASDYTGTITQSGSYTINARGAGWVQLAGTFTGGTGAFTANGDFVLLGGSFTATSGTLTQYKNWNVGSSATFNANSGTLVVAGNYGNSLTVSNENYNNVTVSLGGTMSLSGTMNVLGTLTANQSVCCQTLNGGTIAAQGNITLSGYGFSSDGGTTVVKIAGSGTQTITGTGSPNFPNLTIASTGNVNFSGTFTVLGNYTFTSGTLNAGTSTLVLSTGWGNTITVGSETYNNVTLSPIGTPTLSGTMNVAGTLTANKTGCCTYFNGGTISAQGDVTVTNNGFGMYGGTTIIKIAGSGNQTISGTSAAYFPNLVIASTGGTVTFSGTLAIAGNYTFTSGTLNAGTSTLLIASAGGNTITAGSETYNNVTFSQSGWINVSGTMNVAGTLTGNQSSCCTTINGGTIVAQGDVVLSNNGFAQNGGSTVVKIAGSGSQTITSAAPASFPNLTIASTGGTVSFSGTLSVLGNYTFTSGTLNAGTSTLVIASTSGSTVTVGSETYNNVTFSLNGTTTLSGTMNVAGTLTGNEANCCISLNGGTISAQGNVAVSNNGFAMNGGTTVVKIAGSTNQTITGTSLAAYIPNLTIASTGGAVTISGTVPVKNATSIISGTTSLGSASDKLSTTSLALNSNTLTKNGGTLIVNGTTVGSGSLYGGTVSP